MNLFLRYPILTIEIHTSMTSFDVSNLFTNFPLTETIDIILNSLFPNLYADFKGFSRQLLESFWNLQ